MLNAQSDLRATLAASVFFTETQRLLIDAKNNRNRKALRMAVSRIGMSEFDELLPEEAQEELLALYSAAIAAFGRMSP